MRRPGDLVARYGGEEFVVLLPDTDEAAAAEIAERIRRAVLDLSIEHAGGAERIVSLSAGVAAVCPYEAGGAPAVLLEAADRALYAAKSGGRNLVMRASIGPAPSEDRARA
jgi:diguanylate cyclase (GGDEF)-like protein